LPTLPHNLTPKKTDFSDDFLSEIELLLSKDSDDLPNDLEHEVDDWALNTAALPEHGPQEPPEDQKDEVKDEIPQTYSEFLKRLPIIIMNAKTMNGTDYAPLIADIVPWLAKNMRTTDAQIEEWIECAFKDGSAYSPQSGRIGVL